MKTYCSNSCSGKAGKLPIVEKNCPKCGVNFRASSAKKGRTHCSIKCAKTREYKGYSEEAKRKMREAGYPNLKLGLKTDEVLRRREAYKYVNIKPMLDASGIVYLFEQRLNHHKWIFDLSLPEYKLLVEFDARYHKSPCQISRDMLRDAAAISEGWKVIRLATNVGVLDDSVTEALKKLLANEVALSV